MHLPLLQLLASRLRRTQPSSQLASASQAASTDARFAVEESRGKSPASTFSAEAALSSPTKERLASGIQLVRLQIASYGAEDSTGGDFSLLRLTYGS